MCWIGFWTVVYSLSCQILLIILIKCKTAHVPSVGGGIDITSSADCCSTGIRTAGEYDKSVNCQQAVSEVITAIGCNV